MTTANKITILRVLLVPVFLAAALLGQQLLALFLFVLAGATDWLDGYIARKADQITDFGRFMDPLADKLLVTAALLFFIQTGQMPLWVVMLVLTREFAVSGLRMMAAAQGKVIAAGKSGKLKTAVTFLGITLMLTTFHNFVILGPHELLGSLTLDGLFTGLILLTTIYSGCEYLRDNYKVFWEK